VYCSRTSPRLSLESAGKVPTLDRRRKDMVDDAIWMTEVETEEGGSREEFQLLGGKQYDGGRMNEDHSESDSTL